MKNSGSRKAFQLPWKLKIDSATSAGIAFGRMICANIL
jgi:hypothetical protein